MLQRLEIAVAVGVAEFNMGSKGTRMFMDEIGLKIHCHTERLGKRRDVKRMMKAERAISTEAKRRRTIVRDAGFAEEEEIERCEGGPQYGSGLDYLNQK